MGSMRYSIVKEIVKSNELLKAIIIPNDPK